MNIVHGESGIRTRNRTKMSKNMPQVMKRWVSGKCEQNFTKLLKQFQNRILNNLQILDWNWGNKIAWDKT